MFMRRPRAATPSAHIADTQMDSRAALLARVREGIVELGVAQREVERQAGDLRAKLANLDGLAQRVALAGMLQHGIEILDYQRTLTAQLDAVSREQNRLLDSERQLRAAEQRLAAEEQAGAPEPRVTTPNGVVATSDTEPVGSADRLRSLTRLESVVTQASE